MMSNATAFEAPSASDAVPGPAPVEKRFFKTMSKRTKWYLFAIATVLLLSFVSVVTGADDLTSSGTVGATLRLSMPIMLAGLAGVWAERSGVVNIGIEGMMILGTWAGGFGAWHWGAWAGLGLAIVGGLLGGLLHALATVTFNVDHIISGVAINTLAFGVTRYLSAEFFLGQPGGGMSQSPKQSSAIGLTNVPFLSGGSLFGWKSPDMLGWVEKQNYPFLSDIAGLARGLVHEVSWATILAIALAAVTSWVLWRTRFGLRVRSSGEAPFAAESLGVRVQWVRYRALALSGAFAGLAGGYLAIISNSSYREGQTAGRGYIGLATTIFGNWRPSGVFGGAVLFGFTDALQLRKASSLTALLLFAALALLAIGVWMGAQQRLVPAISSLVGAALFGLAFITVDKVPEPLTTRLPYAVTLLVLAVSSQSLRPPAWVGRPFRPGEDH